MNTLIRPGRSHTAALVVVLAAAALDVSPSRGDLIEDLLRNEYLAALPQFGGAHVFLPGEVLTAADTWTKAGEGWKIHVSFDSQSPDRDLMARIAQTLMEEGIFHKIVPPADLPEMQGTQQGKHITVYPRDQEEWLHVVRLLDRMMPSNSNAKAPPYDSRVIRDKPIFTRYGLYDGGTDLKIPAGFDVNSLRGRRDGESVDDFVRRTMACPPWKSRELLAFLKEARSRSAGAADSASGLRPPTSTAPESRQFVRDMREWFRAEQRSRLDGSSEPSPQLKNALARKTKEMQQKHGLARSPSREELSALIRLSQERHATGDAARARAYLDQKGRWTVTKAGRLAPKPSASRGRRTPPRRSPRKTSRG